MFSVFVILAIIASILLILIVLIQESKGGGLSSSYSSANSLMGVHKTTDFVEKATWALAAALVIFCIGSAFFLTSGTSSVDEVVNKAATKTVTTPQMPGAAPAATTPATAPAK